MSVEKSKLEQLKDSVGIIAGPLESPRGKEWNPRLKDSQDWYEKESADWDELRAMYAKPYHEIKTSDGTTILVKLSTAWSMAKNHVADLYFRNPDPYIRTRRGRSDRHFDKMICDVARAVHTDAKTEEVTRKCLYTGLFQGGGISWLHFEQDGYWADVPKLPQGEETGEPAGEPDEAGEPEQEFVATAQRVVDEFVPLSNMLFDPDGRSWDFSDHKWIGRKYKRRLSQVIEDESTSTDLGRQMLVNAIAGNDSYRSRDAARDGRRASETDPAHITITFVEVWDRTTLTISHIPIIGGQFAMFDMHAGANAPEWPRGFKIAKRFPACLIAEEWCPPDKEETEGFYPVPLLRYARGIIEDIIRLYELFFEAATSVVDKYATWEGMLRSDDFVAVMTSDRKDIIQLDPEKARQVLGTNDLSGTSAGSMLQRIDRGEEQVKALNFAAMIESAKRELYETFGQGAADRGGVSEAHSATEVSRMAAKQDQRNSDAVEQLGKAFDYRTELIFLLLETYQTLPIPYLLTTDSYSKEAWSEFEVEQLYGLDLVFSHYTDSSRPRNRNTERLERSDFMTKALPFISSRRQIQKLVAWAFETYDYPGDMDDLFADQAPEIAKQLIQLQMEIQDNPQLAADPKVGMQMTELATQLAQSVLSPKDLEEIAMGGAGDEGSAAAGAGAAPKSKTPGQIAAAGAAAGMSNVG